MIFTQSGDSPYIDVMVIPLDLLTKRRENVYEMTCATIRRAVQINLAGDEDLIGNQNKIVSTAIKQILSGKVLYTLED